jgi:hypothetical protein
VNVKTNNQQSGFGQAVVDEVAAQELTREIGGRWFVDHGIGQCPVCLRSHGLTIEAGRRVVLIHCSSRCDRRTIVNVLRARGVLR